MNKYVLGFILLLTGGSNVWAQNVGIGTNNPQTKLQVEGAIATSPVTGSAGASIVIPDNVSLYIITDDGAVAANAVSATSPKEGQYLNILNSDAQAAVLNGVHNIPSGGVGQFQYIAGNWHLTGGTNSAPAFTPGDGLSLNGSVLNSTWTKTGNDISNNNTGNVGIGTSSPNAAAILDVSSANKGFLPPRMTTAQRNAISMGMNNAQMQAIQGMTVYNTDNGCLESFIGTNATQSQNWQPIGCGCTSAPAVPTAISLPNVVCQGYNSYIYSVTQVVGASSYNWILPSGATIANGLGTSSITVNFAANAASGTQAISVTAVNACGISPVLTQNITVNQIPRITTQPVSATICAQGAGNSGNTSFTVVATGTALTYQWQVNRNDGNGFVNITAGAPYTNFTTATLNITAANTAINGHQYQCVVSGSCSPSVTTTPVTVTVNPVPVVNNATVATCSGATFTVTPTGTIPAGTTYAWAAPSGSGFTGGLALSGQNNVLGVLTNPSTTSVATAVYTVTPTSANGCVGSTFTVTVTINPTPQVTAPALTTTTTCNGGTQAAITLNTTNNVPGGVFTFGWTRASNNGTGIGVQSTVPVTAMPSFTATNSGTSQITDGINVTPIYVANGQTCVGGPVLLFNYTVNPTPAITVATGQTQTLCVGNATTAVTVNTTATGGTMTYPWTNTTTGINLAASGLTTPIASFSAANATTAPLVGTINITPVYTLNGVGCSGTAATATITVNPTPTITITAGTPQTLCVGSATVAITTSSTATGPGTVTYPWANNNTGIGLGSSGANTPIASFTTTNGAGANIAGTIAITPVYTYNGVGCAGTAANAVVNVNAASVAGTVTQNPGTGNHVCQGSNVTYTLSGQTGTFNYFEFQWNTTGGAYSGSWGTTNPYTWTSGVNGASILYVRAAVKNGVCPIAYSAPVDVTVDATSVAGSITQNPGTGGQVCAGSNVTYTLSGQTGTFNQYLYQWNASSGIPGSYTAWYNTNPATWPSGTNGASVLYVIGQVKNGVCPAVYTTPVNITVNAPSVAGTITQTPATNGRVCQGSNVTYSLSGQTGTFNYYEYQWNTTSGAYSGSWATTNPYTWGSSLNGPSVLYVRSAVTNGACPTAYSAPVNVTVDAFSSTGSFVTNPIYSCSNGTLYNGSWAQVTQGITGYTGTINGWAWGTSATCSANNAGYPYAAGQANMGLGCCWPGTVGNPTNRIAVTVTNGVCPSAQSCIQVQSNGQTAPTGGSVSPNNGCGGGGNVTLTYSGGNTGQIPGGYYQWYAGSCGGTPIGTGQSLVLAAPTVTTNYYVATVDVCGTVSTCFGPITYTAVTHGSQSFTNPAANGTATNRFTVPCGVTSITIDMTGAAGGQGYGSSSTIGRGGRVQATLSVTAGQVINLYVGGVGGNGGTTVGGAGGTNGGGAGGGWSGGRSAGGGGGATDVRVGGTAIGNRVLVAAGGGGVGMNYNTGSNGGNGGGITGSDGASGAYLGGGATQFAGGTPNGALGTGGPGTAGQTGGGGGGGYYGGGGSAWESGGGGSSFPQFTGGSVTSVVHTGGYQAGNGYITITY